MTIPTNRESYYCHKSLKIFAVSFFDHVLQPLSGVQNELVLSNQQSKTPKYSVCSDVKQRKVINHHVLEDCISRC